MPARSTTPHGAARQRSRRPLYHLAAQEMNGCNCTLSSPGTLVRNLARVWQRGQTLCRATAAGDRGAQLGQVRCPAAWLLVLRSDRIGTGWTAQDLAAPYAFDLAPTWLRTHLQKPNSPLWNYPAMDGSTEPQASRSPIASSDRPCRKASRLPLNAHRRLQRRVGAVRL